MFSLNQNITNALRIWQFFRVIAVLFCSALLVACQAESTDISSPSENQNSTEDSVVEISNEAPIGVSNVATSNNETESSDDETQSESTNTLSGTQPNLNNGSSVALAGLTDGSLVGNSLGQVDSFVRVYDSSGANVLTRQVGTSGFDMVTHLAMDVSGNLYVAGTTDGTLVGSNRGGTDIFFRVISPSGVNILTRQFGTAENETLHGFGLDSEGGIVLAGATSGSLIGQAQGETDLFVRVYDLDGTTKFTRQFGTPEEDEMDSLSLSNNRIYIAGTTEGALIGDGSFGGKDIFIRAYDSSGNIVYTRRVGTDQDDFGAKIVLGNQEEGVVYLAGNTNGNVVGTGSSSQEIFLRSYDSNGDTIFTRQFGSESTDEVIDLSTDMNGNIYVSGNTLGALIGTSNRGENDIFLRVYNPDGTIVFTRQFGTSENDILVSSDVSLAGDVYLIGDTNGSLVGENRGGADVFFRAYSSDGSVNFTRQIGTSGDETAADLNTDASGNAYLGGSTSGVLSGSGFGSVDAFIRIYSSTGELTLTRQFGTAGDDSVIRVH